MSSRATPGSTSRIFIGVGLGVVLAAPLAAIAELTIPDDPFTPMTQISSTDMNDYMNQLKTHLQAPMIVSDVVVNSTFDDAAIVGGLDFENPLTTLGGPVRLEFMPSIADGALPYVEASAPGSANCSGILEIERQTDGGGWTRVAQGHLLGTGAGGNCGIRMPPTAFSAVDIAPAGTHNYRLRVIPDGNPGSFMVVSDFALAAYELRGVVPPT